MAKKKEKVRFFTHAEVLLKIDGLPTTKKYGEVEGLSVAGDACIWVPESKTLVILPLNGDPALLWLGGDDSQPVKINERRGSHNLAKFVVRGRIEVDKLDLVPELNRAEILRIAQRALAKLDGPYKSRLVAFLLSQNKG